MGKYIGTASPYGIYERQTFIITSPQSKFTLSYKIGYSTSVLVIWDYQGASKILVPEEDYFLVDGGTAIQINPAIQLFIDDAAGSAEKLHILYLGREVSVPAAKSPLLVQRRNQTGATIFVTNEVILDPAGLLVIKNGLQLSHGSDFTINADGVSINLAVDADPDVDVLDFYVFSGITRLQTTNIVDSSITTNKIANKNISAEKLNLKYTPYTPTISNTLGKIVITGITCAESLYLLQGLASESSGVPVKIRVKFSCQISGTDNKIRFSLPADLKNISTVIGGSVVISNDKTVETGILRWAGDDVVDIYRPAGVNFESGIHTFEAAFEYLGRASSV